MLTHRTSFATHVRQKLMIPITVQWKAKQTACKEKQKRSWSWFFLTHMDAIIVDAWWELHPGVNFPFVLSLSSAVDHKPLMLQRRIRCDRIKLQYDLQQPDLHPKIFMQNILTFSLVLIYNKNTFFTPSCDVNGVKKLSEGTVWFMAASYTSLNPGKCIFDSITPRGWIRKWQVTVETKRKK